MNRYNVIVKHAITKEWTVVYWHGTDLMEAHRFYTTVKNTGLPCKLIEENYPEDIIKYEANM